ncbi:MAG: glycosyltransferase family 4 protein [Phycisphaerales bacterium]|nr:glycosyltransferase family 4 protein [Phycisphaerales bacterium]
MRIAQVSPLCESVPPKLYGGTERIVSYLTEELVKQGHEVTLFASGDSATRARLVSCCERALRLSGSCLDAGPYHLLMLEQVYEHARQFDVIHFHIDYVHFPLARRLRTVNVTTTHGRLDLPDLVPLFREYAEMPLVSISQAQRRPLPDANWLATVHHGIPDGPDMLRPFGAAHGGSNGYLAFLGRASPEKGLDRAIEIARRAGRELRVAAKVDNADRAYFDARIAPLMRQPHVTYVGEIGEESKGGFLEKAAALVFPINWPEPFGLVLIEAMARGTPVIAFRAGSVEEVIEEGVSGFVCEGMESAVEAVARLGLISRARCREAFDRRFSAARMAREYLEVYERLMKG